jgi:4,5:9,10-diseco-3-hydroxy-5,9,17-trioxoandrosta-1(10),2-diene-4-oate hydrolase
MRAAAAATRRSDASDGAAVPRRAAVGAQLPCEEIVADGVRLAYNAAGAGDAVVCLHAIGHGAGDFVSLAERLRGRYRVVALDWPGHGRSGADRVAASAQRYAELLRGVLDALTVRQPILIGNSIGGAAALAFAHAHPGAVRALVLENPGGLAPTDDRLARAALAGMEKFFAAGARGAPWFPTAFAAYYRVVLRRRAAAAQRRRIVASAFEIAPILHQAWQSFAAPEADQRAVAAEIRCPVLFAWATGDQFVQLRRSRAAIARFPNARLERFRAGHAAHLETPDAFEAAVERFLNDL